MTTIAQPNVLLYSSVGINLIGATPVSRLVVTGNNYGYHNDTISIVDINGVEYIYRGGVGSLTESAPLEIFTVVNQTISLANVLYSNGSNKILVGDFLNNGSEAIFLPAFTDNFPSTVLGSYFIQTGSNSYQQVNWLDLQAHGPSIGQFQNGGTTYVLTPAQWPQGENGTWLTWYDNTTSQVQNQFLTSIVGTSSAIIPATANSSEYVFLGQSSNGGDAIIPIAFQNGAPVVDQSKSIEYFSGFWSGATDLALAQSFQTTQNFLANNPLYPGLVSYDHTTQAQVADLNGDGLPDVIATQLFEDPQSFTYALAIYQQQKNGTFLDVTKTSFTDFQYNESGPYKFYIVDVNHDGHPDIVWGEINYNINMGQSLASAGAYALSNTALYINDGAGHFIRAATDQTLFNEFQNRQIAVVPLADGSYDIVTFDSAYNSTPQFTASLYQGIQNYTGPNGINPALRGAPGFNEAFYLDTYSDAASAVLSGSYATALDFYLAIGRVRGDEVCAPNTVIYGSSGADTFIYHISSSSATIAYQSNGSFSVIDATGAYGADTFSGVEKLQFTDQTVYLLSNGVYGGGNSGFSITGGQLAGTIAALAPLTSSYALTVTGVAASNAVSIVSGGHISALAIFDTALNIAMNLNALEALAISGKLTSITLSDTHQLALTSAQQANDLAALNLIVGGYSVTTYNPPVITAMSNRSIYIPAGWQKIDPAFFGDGSLQLSSTNTITQYRITDVGGHLQFYANGAVVTGNNFTFSNPYLNGQLSTDVYVRGLSAGTDTLTISAYDGATWSNAVTFTDVVKAADTPFTVSSNGIKATTQANGSGGTLLSSLVNFSSSSSGNGVMQLQFYDAGGGNDGHFTFFDGANTNSVSAGQVIWLNVASQIPTVKYVASTTPGSAETLYVNAYDGYVWSGWYSWNQVSGSSANNAPVITHMDDRTASIQSGWTQVNTSFLSDGSFTVTDANSDAISKYRIIDTTTTGTHVQFYKAGANGGFVAAGQTMEFTASDVTNGKLYYQGVSIGMDTLTIQAYDGQDWSSAYTYHITVRSADTPLTIAASNSNPSGSTPLSSLVNITNSNHDNVVQLQFYNDAINNDGGYFTYLDGNGASQKVQPGIIANLTTLAQVASVQYVAGNMMVASSEMIHLNAFNGYNWSGWTGLTEQANTSSQMMLGLSNDRQSGILENSTFGTPTQVSNGLPVLANYLESSGQQIHLDTRTLTGLSADTNGNLLASQFISGAGVKMSMPGIPHLAYDTNDGGLYYMPSGANAPIEIAIIGQSGHFSQLHAADFHLG